MNKWYFLFMMIVALGAFGAPVLEKWLDQTNEIKSLKSKLFECSMVK